MSTLPTELLHLIVVAQVALPFVSSPDSDTNEYKKDLATLRSLRLANWELSGIASQYLFEEVTLYFTEASHVKTMAIAQHSTYRSYVRSLRIAPKAIKVPCLTKDAFEQWFRDHRSRFLSDSSGRLIPADLCLPMKGGNANFHHAQYEFLYQKQSNNLIRAEEFSS